MRFHQLPAAPSINAINGRVTSFVHCHTAPRCRQQPQTQWVQPAVGRLLPGFRPCGFSSSARSAKYRQGPPTGTVRSWPFLTIGFAIGQYRIRKLPGLHWPQASRLKTRHSKIMGSSSQTAPAPMWTIASGSYNGISSRCPDTCFNLAQCRRSWPRCRKACCFACIA